MLYDIIGQVGQGYPDVTAKLRATDPYGKSGQARHCCAAALGSLLSALLNQSIKNQTEHPIALFITSHNYTHLQ